MNLRSLFPLAALACAISANADQDYSLQSRLYVYRDADFKAISLSGSSVDTATHVLAFREPVQASFDGARLGLAGGAITWSTATPPPALSFVPTPQVLMKGTQPVVLGSSIPVEYMESQPDGSLKVRKTEPTSADSPHYRVRVSLAQASADLSTLNLDCDLDISTVLSRSAVPGVSLPVGKPALATFSRRVSFNTSPGAWTALTIRKPNGSDYSLLLFLKLTPEIVGETQLRRVAVAHLQVPRVNSVVVTDGRYIYAAGGMNDSGILSSLERFDTTTGQGTMMPVNLRPRAAFAGAVLNGKLYLFGGFHQDSEVDNAVEIVDLATGSVTAGALMPNAPTGFSATAVNGKIYTIGGMTRSAGVTAFTRRVQVYDPSSNTWAQATPMPSPRKARSAVDWDGQIVVLAGFRPPQEHTGVRTVDSFIVESNVWYPMKDLGVNFDEEAAARVNDRVYLFGNTGDSEDVFEYNLTTGATLRLKSNFTPVYKAGAVTVGRTVYLVGGTTDTTRPHSNASDDIQIFMPPTIR